MRPDAIGRIIASQWEYIAETFNGHQRKTFHAIRSCRTTILGGHQYRCNHCGGDHIRYNSCRNRHCPQCQNTQREEWIFAQERRMPGNKFYHIVFTIPSELNGLFIRYPRGLYAALMRVGWSVLQDFGWNKKYVGGQIGATIVLHTWGSNLSYHPHIHCIVPGGGVSLRGQWKEAKGKGKYLFPVKAMSKVYRARMLAAIRKLLKGEGTILTNEQSKLLRKEDWVVYCKPPFGGKEGVVRYLGRYTHKIAITHHRIISYDQQYVRFKYTDYRHGNVTKQMRLTTKEFIRRLSFHILPKRFCRIRHYGILSGRWRQRFEKVEHNSAIKSKTPNDWKDLWAEKGLHVDQCPKCKKGKLELVNIILPKRGPPPFRKHKTQNSK